MLLNLPAKIVKGEGNDKTKTKFSDFNPSCLLQRCARASAKKTHLSVAFVRDVSCFRHKVRIPSDFNYGNRCPTFVFIRYKMLEIVLNCFLFVLLYDESYGIYLHEKLKKSCAGVPVFAFCISYIHSCLGLDLGCFCILFLA